MSKHGSNLLTLLAVTWLFGSIVLIPGSMDSNTYTVEYAIKSECVLTILLGIAVIVVALIDKGARTVKGNVDKAINCLQLDRLDSRTDDEQLNQAMRYIMRERAERRAKEKEARRLAERKASR